MLFSKDCLGMHSGQITCEQGSYMAFYIKEPYFALYFSNTKNIAFFAV